jgi:Family of unknown function (DUF6284)
MPGYSMRLYARIQRDAVSEPACAEGDSTVEDPTTGTPRDDEPTADELAAIERESGLLAAELALLDAEIHMLAVEDEASDVDWQRLRRAMRDVVRENAELFRGHLDDDTESSEGEAA